MYEKDSNINFRNAYANESCQMTEALERKGNAKSLQEERRMQTVSEIVTIIATGIVIIEKKVTTVENKVVGDRSIIEEATIPNTTHVVIEIGTIAIARGIGTVTVIAAISQGIVESTTASESENVIEEDEIDKNGTEKIVAEKKVDEKKEGPHLLPRKTGRIHAILLCMKGARNYRSAKSERGKIQTEIGLKR